MSVKSIAVDARAKEQFYAKMQEPLSQARLNAAAWTLGVAGANIAVRKQQEQLYECTEDVANLRKRLDQIASKEIPGQQVCLKRLREALLTYGATVERSDSCLLLLEEQLAEFERKLKTHTSQLDKVTARMQSKRLKESEAGDIGSKTRSKRR